MRCDVSPNPTYLSNPLTVSSGKLFTLSTLSASIEWRRRVMGGRSAKKGYFSNYSSAKFCTRLAAADRTSKVKFLRGELQKEGIQAEIANSDPTEEREITKAKSFQLLRGCAWLLGRNFGAGLWGILRQQDDLRTASRLVGLEKLEVEGCAFRFVSSHCFWEWNDR